jgi:hypothetical protein
VVSFHAIRPSIRGSSWVFVGATDIDEAGVVKGRDFRPYPSMVGRPDQPTDQDGGHSYHYTFLTLAASTIWWRIVARTPWVPLVSATVITKKAWDAIRLQQRQAFRQAALRSGKQMQARGRQENIDAIEAMKKRGLQVHAVSPALLDEWQNFCAAVYPRMRGSMVPADMFDEVLRLLKQYRDSGGGAKS